MSLDSGLNKGEKVLYEFKHEGTPAQVVMVQKEDLDQQSEKLLAENLAANYKLLDIPHAAVRSKVRGITHVFRDRILNKVDNSNQGLVGSLRLRLADKLKNAGEVIYPDISHAEELKSVSWRWRKLIEDGNLFGIKVEGKLVAVQGYMKVGDTSSGREVFELNKASTVNDPKYRKQGFNRRLLMAILQKATAEHKDLLWAGSSVNPEVIASAEKHGFHVVEMDDQHEAVVAINSRNPGYAKILKEKGYKAFYFDPKVDQLKI